MFSYNQPQRNTGEFLKQIFFSRNVLSRLILINTVIYLIVNIVGVISSIFSLTDSNALNPLVKILALPADLGELSSKPWTLITYMFLHESFFHLLFNVVMLYFGGKIFQEYLNQVKLFWTYVIGGVFGGLFFILAFNSLPAFDSLKSMSVAMGASASVLGIIIAISTYVPDYTVHLFLFGKFKLKYLAIAFIAIDVLSIQSDNPGGHIAHLGGALWGFIYAFSLKKGKDVYKIFYKLYIPKFTWNKKNIRFDTSRPISGKPLSDDEYNMRRAATQEEIDQILDKISTSGYSSLTNKEKELLFKTSKKK